MTLGVFMHDNATLLLLAAAALGWYIASHASADALARGNVATRARGIGHWIPILITAVAAAILGQPHSAVGVLFGTAVATLSLVLGIVISTQDSTPAQTTPGGLPIVPMTRPAQPHGADVVESQSPARRLWAFVLPAALIALLAGFSGRLTLLHAMILLIQGFAILLVWGPQCDDDRPLLDARHHGRESRYRIELLLAVVLAAVSGSAGLRAAVDIEGALGLVSSGFVSALMISPALVLPMIGSGMTLARSGFCQSVVTMCVCVVLLNLCFALPVVIALWHARPVVVEQFPRLTDVAPNDSTPPSTTPATVDRGIASQAGGLLRFPLRVWRIDTVILILLGLILLPLSVGRWPIGRVEGMLLIVIYIAYMGLTTWSVRG